MITEDLEQILNSGIETQRHELKAACSWDVKLFIKSILAISNLSGGGYIIVGVNNDFVRVGLDEQQIGSFNFENMKDQVGLYADPKVDFIIEVVSDLEGKKYVAIRVMEFEEIPVICKKDNSDKDIRKGMIYYRNSDRRPESAVISNSSDMRDLMELAAVKKMRKLSKLGLTIETKDEEKLNEELEGL